MGASDDAPGDRSIAALLAVRSAGGRAAEAVGDAVEPGEPTIGLPYTVCPDAALHACCNAWRVRCEGGASGSEKSRDRDIRALGRLND